MVAGISISKWGPSAWHFLHTISFTYSETPSDADKQNMYAFLHAFAQILPCKKCRIEFTEYITKHVTHSSELLDSRESLIQFIHEAHNHVNMRLGKPIVGLNRVRYWYMVEYDTHPHLIRVVIVIGIILCLMRVNKKIYDPFKQTTKCRDPDRWVM